MIKRREGKVDCYVQHAPRHQLRTAGLTQQLHN